MGGAAATSTCVIEVSCASWSSVKPRWHPLSAGLGGAKSREAVYGVNQAGL